MLISVLERLKRKAWRKKNMPKLTVKELDFLRLTGNHLEFSRKLTSLDCPNPDITQHAQYIGAAWFRLGEQHLVEAKKILSAGCPRAAYSRAYYAAYNASKGTRYIATGSVSMKGDDHGKASSELPGGFPDEASWANRIIVLYEHRLHADYDNWSDTANAFRLTPEDAVKEAEDFISAARHYINNKFGMSL